MNTTSNSESRHTRWNLLSGLLTFLVQLAVNFFLSPFIVKSLGEAANGFTQLANNFVQYASLITIAFNSMAGRFMSVSYHKNNKKQASIYYSTIIIANILITVILGIIAVFIILNLENILVIENNDIIDIKILFSCVFINFFVNIVLSIFGIAFFVKNKIYYQNIIIFLRNLLNALLLFVIFSICKPRMFYVSAITMFLSIITLPLFLFLKNKVMSEIKFEKKLVKINAAKEIFLSGIWNTLNQCGNMLMTGMDLLLTNLFLGPTIMGTLSVAKTIPNAILSLASIFNTNFLPSITINWAKGDKIALLAELKKSVKISSVFLAIPIITFTVFSVPFYKLWVPTLDAKVLAVISFLTIMAFIPWTGPQTLYNIFTASNKLKVNTISFFIGGIINVIIVYILLKTTSLGIYAIAGVSSIISILRNMLIICPYTAKLLNQKWYYFYKDVWISIECCLINFICGFIVLKLLKPLTWIELIASVLITVLITLILNILLILDNEEKSILKSKIGGLKIGRKNS